MLFDIAAIVDSQNSLNTQRKHREFAIRKFHVITETFLSLVGTDEQEDIDLLVQVYCPLLSNNTAEHLTVMLLADMHAPVVRWYSRYTRQLSAELAVLIAIPCYVVDISYFINLPA